MSCITPKTSAGEEKTQEEYENKSENEIPVTKRS